MSALERQIHDCVTLLRLGHDVEGALMMVAIVDTLIAALAHYPPGVAQAFPAVLNAMLHAQQRQDWLGLADTLQVELLQLLSRERV